MTRHNRLDKVEARLNPEAKLLDIQMCHETCEAYRTLTSEAHEAWHRDRGDYLFTMDLGNANVRAGDAV